MINVSVISVPSIAIVVLLLAFDMQNLIARFKRAVALPDESSSDYTLVVPLFGDPRILTNLRFLLRHKPHVLLVLNTTNEEMLAFAKRMEADGWRVHRTCLPGRPRVSRMWQLGLSAVTTTYAMRVDADTTSRDDPGRAIRALELSGADYASAKVLVNNPRTVVQHLQASEYAMSMQARHFRPWMTSGACIFGRTSALRAVLAVHTHWWNGEDVEQGIIAKHFRMRIVHVDYNIYTDVPKTAKALFRQRRLWWAGSVRQTLVNIDQMIWFPAYIFYNLFLVYAALIFRGRMFGASPLEYAVTLPLMLVFYVAITSIANFKVWSRWFLIFPLYSLVQVTVMPAVGIFEFVRTAISSRSSGRYLIGWRRESWTPDPVSPTA